MAQRPLPDDLRHARPARPGRSFAIGGALAVALLAGGGYSALWLYVRDQAEDILADQIAGLEAQGYQTSWSGVRWGGYPGRVHVTFDEPSVIAPRHAGDWSWSAGELRLSLWPWAYQTIYADAEGEHVVRAPGREVTRISAEGLSGMAAFDNRGGLNAAWLSAGPAHADVAGARVAELEAARIDVRRSADGGSYDIEAHADRPRAQHLAPGAAPARARADATILAGDVLVAFGTLDERALSAWSSEDGALQIDEACVSWEPRRGDAALVLATDQPAQPAPLPEGSCFAVEGPALGLSGALSLDAVGRWNGQLNLQAREPSEALARLAALGVMSESDARQAGAVAQMAAGEAGAMRVPLQVREGGLYLSFIALAELPRAF